MFCGFNIRTSIAVVLSVLAGVASGTEIRVQSLDLASPAAGEVRRENVFSGEVAEVEIEHVALAGPLSRSEPLANSYDSVFLFISGRGNLRSGDESHDVERETIAVPFSLASISIDVAEGEALNYLRLRKQISPQDRQDIQGFPAENRGSLYFKKFSDCPAYTEAIKSPKTISRTVLPKDHVPRTAMGTVDTMGPDQVGAHEHPMLDQLFLGLTDNDCIVHADDSQVRFPAFSILHIPLGSRHWVEVGDGRRMYYMWMDFFITAEGQEWLKTHQPVGGQPN